jgi:outer membrane protein OmpA-like peptidoglycan-associated protein
MARKLPIIGSLNFASIGSWVSLLRVKNCRHCGAVWIAAAMLPFAVYGWLPQGGVGEITTTVAEQIQSTAKIALNSSGMISQPEDAVETKAPQRVVATVATPPPALTAPSTQVTPVVPSLQVETAALPENTCAANFAAVLTKSSLTFGFDSAKVLPENGATLDQLAGIAKRCDAFDIRVDGHTDLNGRAAYNQKLSEQRAEAVRKELIKRGVREAQISAKGFGSSKPLTTKISVVEPSNRRIEFTVTGRATR